MSTPTPTAAPVDSTDVLNESLLEFVALVIGKFIEPKAGVRQTAEHQARWLERNGYKIVRDEGCSCPCSVEFPN